MQLAEEAELAGIAAVGAVRLEDRGQRLEGRVRDERADAVLHHAEAQGRVAVAIRAERRVRVVHVEAAQPVEPDRGVEARERLVEGVGVGDVDAGDEPVARVETDPEPGVAVEPVDEGRELVDRAAQRPSGAGGVLEDEPEPLVGELE